MKRVLTILLCMGSPACDSGFQRIDTRVAELMQETSDSMGAKAPPQQMIEKGFVGEDLIDPKPKTVNPRVNDLSFFPSKAQDVESVSKTFDQTTEILKKSSTVLSLEDALAFANNSAKELQFAQYDYLSATLSLLSEQYLWGPRFFNTISGDITADSTGGLYDTSLSVVNDFSVTKNLQNGGSVSASALTTVARRLHNAATNEESSDTDLSVQLEIPLMRGSGAIARESLIQAQRNMIYAARTYERFRRTFYRSLVGDYLSLVVQKKSLENAQRSVDSLQQLAARQKALYESGRSRLYDSADSENQALAAVASLSQSWERYRLALDNFKIRIGWSVEESIQVEGKTIGVVPPLVNPEEAVGLALQYRLDLQNEYDQLVDKARLLENSANDLLPSLSLTTTATLASDANKPMQFNEKELDYLGGLEASLPLDQEDERIAVKQAEIALTRARRSYRETRDDVAIGVRSALRNIEVYQFSYDLQVRNVEIAQLGLDSINADPDRASVLDQTRAISDLQSAKDARDNAKRDLELSILDYLLQAGQLRVGDNGNLLIPPNDG